MSQHEKTLMPWHGWDGSQYEHPKKSDSCTSPEAVFLCLSLSLRLSLTLSFALLSPRIVYIASRQGQDAVAVESRSERIVGLVTDALHQSDDSFSTRTASSSFYCTVVRSHRRRLPPSSTEGCRRAGWTARVREPSPRCAIHGRVGHVPGWRVEWVGFSAHSACHMCRVVWSCWANGERKKWAKGCRKAAQRSMWKWSLSVRCQAMSIGHGCVDA